MSKKVAPKIEHGRRMKGLALFIAAFEAEYGELTDEELASAKREARRRSTRMR